MNNLFITGTSGFIGSRLVDRVSRMGFDHIYCLSRNPAPVVTNKKNPGITYVRGDVRDIDSYAEFLAECSTVIHLAAATGKQEIESYFSINDEGTTTLLNKCKQVGVSKILYISTIAVNYPDKTHYYYALSKEKAESAVIGSGLNYTIVRPTIVLGKNSPIWRNLSGLAKRSVIPFLGDGTAKIQPIHVDDLVSCLLTILREDLFDNEVFELGGQDVVSFDDFLISIHSEYTGKSPRIIHLPYNLIKPALVFSEKLFYKYLPVNSGQLSAFNNNGTATPNRLQTSCSNQMKSLRDHIKELIIKANTEIDENTLKKECTVFTTYLLGVKPTDYVIRKYIQAHQYMNSFNGDGADPFNHRLVRFAAQRPIFTRIGDSYSSFFYKDSLLRKKLILLLAILESCIPFTKKFDAPDAASPVGIGFTLVWRGIIFMSTFLLGMVIFIPTRVISSRHSKPITEVGELWAE